MTSHFWRSGSHGCSWAGSCLNNGTFLPGVSGLVTLARSASQTSITKLDRIPLIAEFKHLSHVSHSLDHISLQNKSNLKAGEMVHRRRRASRAKTEARLVSMVGGRGCRVHFISSRSGVTLSHPAGAKQGH